MPLDLGAFGRGGLRTHNISHRLFPRDATEDLPFAPVSVSCFHPTPLGPGLLLPGFPLARPAFGLRQPFVCHCRSNPCLKPCPAGHLADTAGHPLTYNRQRPSTHAPPAARGSPANPFLESPADSSTRAPNLQRLRQSGDARQDLVRNSESTTKCGDYGEESGGDAEVSKIRGESERPLHA